MLSEAELEIYRRVGRIVAEVREHVRPLVKPGVPLLEIAEAAEGEIRRRGAKPAFPCNVSVNSIAAHYSPPAGDETALREGDLVKVDIGAHIDGYIADTAFTVATGPKQELVQVAERALEESIKVIKPGIDVGEIGRVVEETATAAGFKPIRNLTGHKVDRWTLHAGLTVPNVGMRTGQRLEVGDVISLEPFVTDGIGFVKDQPQAYIFRYLRDVPMRLRMARRMLLDIKRTYGTLPLAERWLAEGISRVRLELTLRELVRAGALHAYHVLKEQRDGMVAQAEHTIIVTEGGCEVTTL